jgi:hypothetical protein
MYELLSLISKVRYLRYGLSNIRHIIVGEVGEPGEVRYGTE